MIRKSLVAFLILSLILGSCASHDTIPAAPGNIQALIEPGDKVRIVTKDNQENEFVVVEVTDEAIVGENVKIPFDDITKLEEETRNAWENIFLISLLTIVFVGSEVMACPPFSPYRCQ